MDKPVEPNKEDCCNSGCNPCIFDIYEKQLKSYEKYLKSGESNDICNENGIRELEYTKFVVIKNVNVCNSHNIISLKRHSLDYKRVWWKPGDHFLYKYTTSNALSCTRAYTPIVNDVANDGSDFSIIIKQYDTGVVSPHLCKLKAGSITLWRGPYGHYVIEPNKFSKIIMIAQGTGIAPFLSIIDNILNNEDDMTQIMLLYCCKHIDTILFRKKLYNYRSYWNFKYQIYLSTKYTDAHLKYQEPLLNKKLDCEDLEALTGKEQVLLCGSSEFSEIFNIHIRDKYPVFKNIVIF